jgi:hypothetical protein
MQLFGHLYTLLFVRISRLNWIGRVSTMGSKRKVSQAHNNNPQGRRVRGQKKKKKHGGTVRQQTLVNAKLKAG